MQLAPVFVRSRGSQLVAIRAKRGKVQKRLSNCGRPGNIRQPQKDYLPLAPGSHTEVRASSSTRALGAAVAAAHLPSLVFIVWSLPHGDSEV